MRMCAVSREVRPIDELIRFVVAPSGDVIPDVKRKLPGRGLWVGASRKTVAEAVRRNQFSRGFKRNVRAAATLPADTEALLERSCTEALAMAAKGGQVVSGFAKVEGLLEQGRAHALIHASDGAADGIRKLDGIARQTALLEQEFLESRASSAAEGSSEPSSEGLSEELPAPIAPRELPIVTVLTSDELDLALGRSNVIHAALLAGPASKTFLSRSQTLVRYRMADDGKAGVGGKAKTTARPLVTEASATGTLETESSAAESLATANALPIRNLTE